MESKATKRSEVRRLLAVLGCGVGIAILSACWLLYQYGPSGRYIAGQTLLEPSLALRLEEKERDPQTQHFVYFIFDKHEFTLYTGQKEQKFAVAFEAYSRFYDAVRTEKSLTEVPLAVQQLFAHPSAQLTTFLRAELSSKTQSVQEVEWSGEDYFRIKLQGTGMKQEWAYFFRAGGYREALSFFTAVGT